MSDKDRPLLLLDVDGVLNPFAASRNWLDDSDYRRSRISTSTGTYPVWLDRSHGRMLRDVAERWNLELVWCTTWEHEANLFIGPKVGLPELPVIEFGFTATKWKFNAVLKYAAGRPLAWLDDDFGRHADDEQVWFMERRGDLPTFLRHVDPRRGFNDEHRDAINGWAAGLTDHQAA